MPTNLDQLAGVRRRRLPFERLSRKIIRETVARYLPETGLVVEIGRGDDQLRERLPRAILPRVVQSSAERLPFADGEVAAVLGLSALDGSSDGPAVASELRRVLRPGGRVIHWLDTSTSLDEIMGTLAATELIPLPNVFTDPMASAWPENMFLLQRDELEWITELLAAHDQALAEPLRQYLALFSRVPFERGPAAAEFVRLEESSTIRSDLGDMFRTVYELADPELRRQLVGFKGRPVSSARRFETRLKAWFDGDAGFSVEQSDVVSAWELVPRPDPSFAYLSSSVGEQRLMPYVPESFLCPDTPEEETGETDALVELGIFVFVATRI